MFSDSTKGMMFNADKEDMKKNNLKKLWKVKRTELPENVIFIKHFA